MDYNKVEEEVNKRSNVLEYKLGYKQDFILTALEHYVLFNNDPDIVECIIKDYAKKCGAV